ncbi:MAG: lysylphosphatidylglycerol synthase transmembrane domain-containing protein [Jatrophihabitantaceae bacterium]
MSRRSWAALRLLGGAAILAVLVSVLGAGSFLRGVWTVDGWSLAAAAGIAVLTTLCCAWRWCLVARGLGVAVPLRTAFAAYYRSQFLNTVLPGGVLGDLHRGVAHGRDAGDVGRGLRAVAWERCAGQMVQAALAMIALLALPSPVRSAMPVILGVSLALALAGVALLRVLPHRGSSRWARTLRAVGSDLRDGLLAHRAWPGIVAASVVVVAGHTATFLIAARATGVTASPARMLPLALLILLAMSVPLNIAGWGPREGVAAWAFGAAGLGAGQGVTTAVGYGVLALVANLPGALVLIAGVADHGGRRPERAEASRWRSPAAAHREGVAGG